MTTFQTIEMRSYHCGQIVRRLRMEYLLALARIGRDPHKELRAAYDDSAIRIAWMVNGTLAAVGGVCGPSAAATGYVWLAISEDATRYPVALLREVTRQLDFIMLTKRALQATIIGGDDAAKRFAVFLGFHVSDDGLGASAFTRIGRRSLTRHLDTVPDLRIPIGAGYAIGMDYRAPDA